MHRNVATGGTRGQPARAVRRASGDDDASLVTSGAAGGTSGGRGWPGQALRRADLRDLWRGLLVAAPLTALVCTVNALTNLADIPHVRAWEPWTWEITSGVMILAVMALPELPAMLAGITGFSVGLLVARRVAAGLVEQPRYHPVILRKLQEDDACPAAPQD